MATSEYRVAIFMGDFDDCSCRDNSGNYERGGNGNVLTKTFSDWLNDFFREGWTLDKISGDYPIVHLKRESGHTEK